MNTKYIFTALLLAPMLTASAAGQGTDTLQYAVNEHASCLLSLRQNVFFNPAMQRFHYATSLNVLSAAYQHDKASHPVRLEMGSGHNHGVGNIDAYLQKGKTTLWGNATYKNGNTKGISYCETSDFATLYPYIMADTVGGNNRNERYHFMGGFATALGRWTVGAEGEYTALMEYRVRDPRPKNLTGDLKVKFGLGYALTAQQRIGWKLSARKYKQTNELKLYNEVAVPLVYHFTGLGTDYYRFRGLNTSTYYKGYAIGTGMDWANTTHTGLFGGADYEYTSIEKVISSLNELPMAELHQHAQTAYIGYTTTGVGNGFGFLLHETYSCRNGIENIFGTAQDNIYPQIASAPQYRLTQLNTSLRGVYQHTAGLSGYALSAVAGYENYDERYKEPQRRMKAAAFTAGGDANAHLSVHQWLLQASVSALWRWCNDSRIEMPQAADKTTLFAPVMHFYQVLANRSWQTKTVLAAHYATHRGFDPYVQLTWNYQHYAQVDHTQAIEIALGVSF